MAPSAPDGFQGDGVKFQERIAERTARQRDSAAYDNYLRIRGYVSTMMDDWERLDPEGGPSAYWKEEIEGFIYMFDASPLIIGALREQCYHITGIRSYEYRSHHHHRTEEFAAKFAMLRALDPAGLWIPEAPELAGYGYPIGAGLGLANIDTLKFYEVLIGMEKAGYLPKFRGEQKERRTVVEVGSGWGGFAYQFKKTCPNTTYVCVDLPPTMMFSGVYLTTLFPDAKFLFYGEDGFDEKIKNLKDYDFVFLPHYYFPQWTPKGVDMAVNMVSFQEMTSTQVDGYVRRLAELGCPRIYSLNRDRSPHNAELSTVGEILSTYYKVKRADLLEIPYLHMKPRKTPREASPHDYRTLFTVRLKDAPSG
jgi:hypothetical protein